MNAMLALLLKILLLLAVAGLGFGMGGLYAWSFSHQTTLGRMPAQGRAVHPSVRVVRPRKRTRLGGPDKPARDKRESGKTGGTGGTWPPQWNEPLRSHF